MTDLKDIKSYLSKQYPDRSGAELGDLARQIQIRNANNIYNPRKRNPKKGKSKLWDIMNN